MSEWCTLYTASGRGVDGWVGREVVRRYRCGGEVSRVTSSGQHVVVKSCRVEMTSEWSGNYSLGHVLVELRSVGCLSLGVGWHGGLWVC